MGTYSEPLRTQSLGLYVHVPLCDGKCRYCGFYSEPAANHDLDRLVSALISELDRYPADTPVQTVYLGGGSPTSLPVGSLARLLEAVASRWPGAREFTVECNPGQTDARILTVLRRFGVNRLSFGVQSFHAQELLLLGRRHTADDAVSAIRLAQESGFENIGLDLIFAIPGSTPDAWHQNLHRAVALNVQHISAYSLTVEPGTPLLQAVQAGELDAIDEDTDRAMYEMAIDCLASAGFVQYEISNFAREGFACLHNQGYWDNRSYIGIGPSASSYDGGSRTTNIADIRQYVRRIEAGQSPADESERLNDEDRVCQTAVLNLRTRKGVDLAAFQATTGADFAEVFASPLERHRRLGLLEIEGGRVRLAREALGIADSVLCDFSSF
ncbi:MAG: radical SAM family heme chaperone HemW [Sedimentisphaerales bacterium]|nr:radical SAM family heme chaperone HemW [Sedimentisphaerales bacterium]